MWFFPSVANLLETRNSSSSLADLTSNQEERRSTTPEKTRLTVNR
jgi:hypothetical protein